MLQKILVKPNKKADSVYYQQPDLFFDETEDLKNQQKVLIVETTAAPIDGQANKKVVQLVAEFFGLKKYQVCIKSGLVSKNKILEIKQVQTDLSKDQKP